MPCLTVFTPRFLASIPAHPLVLGVVFWGPVDVGQVHPIVALAAPWPFGGALLRLRQSDVIIA